MSASHGVMPNCAFWPIRSLATMAPWAGSLLPSSVTICSLSLPPTPPLALIWSTASLRPW